MGLLVTAVAGAAAASALAGPEDQSAGLPVGLAIAFLVGADLQRRRWLRPASLALAVAVVCALVLGFADAARRRVRRSARDDGGLRGARGGGRGAGASVAGPRPVGARARGVQDPRSCVRGRADGGTRAVRRRARRRRSLRRERHRPGLARRALHPPRVARAVVADGRGGPPGAVDARTGGTAGPHRGPRGVRRRPHATGARPARRRTGARAGGAAAARDAAVGLTVAGTGGRERMGSAAETARCRPRPWCPHRGCGDRAARREGRLRDLAAAQPAATDLQRELDVVALLVALAGQLGPEAAVAALRTGYGSTPVAEARLAALLQPLALPRAVRRATRATPLLERLRAALRGADVPAVQVGEPRLERLRPRTVISIVGGTAAAYVLAGQLSTVNVPDLLGRARWQWLGRRVARRRADLRRRRPHADRLHADPDTARADGAGAARLVVPDAGDPARGGPRRPQHPLPAAVGRPDGDGRRRASPSARPSPSP